MKPPKRGNPHWRDGGSGYSAKASGLQEDHSTLIRFPHDKWLVCMRLANRIGRTPPPLKPAAVHCWRVSVQAALEARP